MDLKKEFYDHIADSEKDLLVFFNSLTKKQQKSLALDLIVQHRILEENEDYAGILNMVNPTHQAIPEKLDQIRLCAMQIFSKNEFYDHFYGITECFSSEGYNKNFYPDWLEKK